MEEKELARYIELYHGTIYRLAYSCLKNSADADDICSEVFFRLYRYKGSFEADENCKAWLIRVAVNLARNQLKSAWRTRRTELIEYRTETDRYFRLETEAGTRTYGGIQVTLNYILGAEQKSVDLDTECSVDVYRYELKTEEAPTDLFTPKYLEISDLSFSILGMNHKVYVHEVRENGNSWHSLLPVDMDRADFLGTTLIMNDGSRIFLGQGKWALGSQYPLEENYFTDIAVCSGTYNLFDEETQKWSYKSIEAENVEAIELCGAVYELIPME